MLNMRYGGMPSRYGFKKMRCAPDTTRQANPVRMLSLKPPTLDGAAGMPDHAQKLRFFWRVHAMQFRQADFGLTLRISSLVPPCMARVGLARFPVADPPADLIRSSQVDRRLEIKHTRGRQGTSPCVTGQEPKDAMGLLR